MEIREHGVRYRVRFEGGHKTGFFCDQRDNRRDLARFCKGREVLDVCCYSGGFGLSALVNGGASEVTGVDLDEKAVAMAKENANLNQVRMELVHADAFGYLRQMGVERPELRRRGARPAEADRLAGRDGRGQEEVPGSEHAGDGPRRARRPAADLLVLGPARRPRSSSASSARPARRAGRSARVLAVTGAAADHPVGLEAPEGSYLKAVWLLVGDRIERPIPSASAATASTASE